jgi:hypothetical protein
MKSRFWQHPNVRKSIFLANQKTEFISGILKIFTLKKKFGSKSEIRNIRKGGVTRGDPHFEKKYKENSFKNTLNFNL